MSNLVQTLWKEPVWLSKLRQFLHEIERPSAIVRTCSSCRENSRTFWSTENFVTHHCCKKKCWILAARSFERIKQHFEKTRWRKAGNGNNNMSYLVFFLSFVLWWRGIYPFSQVWFIATFNLLTLFLYLSTLFFENMVDGNQPHSFQFVKVPRLSPDLTYWARPTFIPCHNLRFSFWIAQKGDRFLWLSSSLLILVIANSHWKIAWLSVHK